ncbi:MAG: hypothetical protein MJ085_04815 [Clostridia bacterium]|nr:hypothetical protein [Clostridia bacterium]
MPYLFFRCERGIEPIRVPLTRYLSLSGVNLRDRFAPRPDAVGLILTKGSPAVRYRPANARFARCLFFSVRCLFPKATLCRGGNLPLFPVPTVFVSLPDLPEDAGARILTNAVQQYFALPALLDRPEIPIRLGGQTAHLHTLADERSRVLQVLSADSPVTLIGTFDAWSIIRAQEELGFCRTEDLQLY